MSEAERMRDLAAAIAQAYVQNVTYTEKVPKTDVIQTQVMSVICGQDNDSCSNCVLAYDPKLFKEGYFCNNRGCPGDKNILFIRNNQCAPICVCSFEAFQNNTVTLKANATIQEGSISQIIDDTRKLIKQKYPDFIPSSSDIETIIRQQNTAFINQIISSAQIIDLKGLGVFKNVRLSTATNAVLNAIAQNSSNEIRQSVDSYVNFIKPAIEAKIAKTLGQILANFLTAWIILGVLIFVILMINAGLWIHKIAKK
jgi:hypothetical protein